MLVLILLSILHIALGQAPVNGAANGHAASAAAAAATDSHSAGDVGTQSLGGPGIGYPGFPGLGFSKSFSAGYGPLLGALGGFGGVPPPIDGPIGDPGLGFGGFGGLGPSYLPASLIGSWGALKGDILFPCVIVVFFIVGVWTVINFLLALAVPFIAKKMSMLGAVAAGKSFLRRAAEDPQENQKILDGIEKMENEFDS